VKRYDVSQAIVAKVVGVELTKPLISGEDHGKTPAALVSLDIEDAIRQRSHSFDK
jgi:hypothetical protein